MIEYPATPFLKEDPIIRSLILSTPSGPLVTPVIVNSLGLTFDAVYLTWVVPVTLLDPPLGINLGLIFVFLRSKPIKDTPLGMINPPRTELVIL